MTSRKSERDERDEQPEQNGPAENAGGVEELRAQNLEEYFLRKRTPEELNTLIHDALAGRIFFSSSIRKNALDLLPMIFMPLAFGAFTPEELGILERNLGVFYGEMEKALPRTVNGYPVFLEMKALCREDWEKIKPILQRESQRDFAGELGEKNETGETK